MLLKVCELVDLLDLRWFVLILEIFHRDAPEMVIILVVNVFYDKFLPLIKTTVKVVLIIFIFSLVYRPVLWLMTDSQVYFQLVVQLIIFIIIYLYLKLASFILRGFRYLHLDLIHLGCL